MALGDMPSWTIPGVVTEVRRLTTKHAGDAWALQFNILALGGVFQCIATDQALWQAAKEGDEVVAAGRFEQFNGGYRFVLTSFGKGADDV